MTFCICSCVIAVQATVKKGDLVRYARLDRCQLSVLKAAFANNCYLSRTTLTQLVKQTGASRTRICHWFTTRRRQIRMGIIEKTVPISEYLLIHSSIYANKNTHIKYIQHTLVCNHSNPFIHSIIHKCLHICIHMYMHVPTYLHVQLYKDKYGRLGIFT